MQLKKIAIKNYRQFQNAIIDFDEELTILAGSNNSGKTSIIELFTRIFRDKTLSKEDISNEYYFQMRNQFVDCIEKLLKENATEIEFRENAKQYFCKRDKSELIAIKTEIEVQYHKAESISMFSDYLMELDDECTGFYFCFNYEIILNELLKSLSLGASKLYAIVAKIQELESLKNRVEVESEIDELRKLRAEILHKIFDTSFENIVYFTDKNYENEVQLGVKEFQKLFKYNYLNATRLLNDEKTDHYFSISKELLSHFKQSDDWDSFKTQIIKDIKVGLENRKLNEKVKAYSLKKAQKALDNIEKYFDYNKGEFSLQTDISDELLLNFLTSSLQTFFEYKNGAKLKEFSQGLGISNLIYMCLKVEAFVRQYQPDTVNLFIIEEPEAHMHPQMERLLIKFINEILINEDNNRVQGIITTHSNEIIKCSELKNIRVLRIDGPLVSTIYNMDIFKKKLVSKEENQFFSFLFSINYSDLIFANKIIMYEGDTEKLYIEKLLLDDEFKELSNQYISFVQVGGAYTHWYRKLVHFLKIKTLIISDIDYKKELISIDEIKKNDQITNAGITQYYKDYVTLNILKSNVFDYCMQDCSRKTNNCFYDKSEIDQLSFIQSDLRRTPCKKIKRPNFSGIKKKPTVDDINLWMKSADHNLIKIVSQGEEDFYTRTLEEAMLCKLLGITVETLKEPVWWKEKIQENKLKLNITYKKSITVRDIINENKSNKTDFMYSVILADLHLKSLPNYIKEGIDWLRK